MHIDPADLPFTVSQIDRARFYNSKPNAYGTRRLYVDVRLGVRNANRLGTIFGGVIPRPCGGRWRVRIGGTRAEAILAEVMPHLSLATRERAEAALSLVGGK